MKKIIINIIPIFVIITMFFILTPTCYAVTDFYGGASEFVNTGVSGANNKISGTQLQETSNLIYNTLLIVGTVIAVIWGILLGIKFVTGSIEEQAEVKKSVIPYVIGCIIVFGAFGIWKIVVDVVQRIS